MRKVIFVVLALICANTTSNAQSKAPNAVRTAFSQKFPHASKIKWSQENDKEYEADFKWRGIQYSANFSNDGKWLETEYLTTYDKLPPKVQEVFNTTHKGAKIKAIAKIETSSGTIKYEIEFRQGSKTEEVLYNKSGDELKM